MRVLALLVACIGCLAAGAAGAPAKSDHGLIAFWSDEPWPTIWTVRPDGSGLHRILRNGQNAKRPALSPDLKRIVFDGTPPGRTPISDFDVQIVRRDGSGLRTLTHSKLWDTDAQWSPDGALISFTRAPKDEWTRAWIWTVRPDGSNLLRLARGQLGRWSPDGRHLVLDAPTTTSQGNLFIVDADGSHRRLLVRSPELDQAADWSPDGRQILFTRFNATSPGSTVWVVNVDGTGLRRVAKGIAGSWSPDGSSILYAAAFPGRLFVTGADGSGKQAIPGVVGADPDWR
jgi:Tol biopolymer transport system component